MTYKEFKDAVRVKTREKMNIYLGKYRNRKLSNKNVTIISNNCWGGHVYRYLGIEYLSPTIGLYFFADDYVKFCKNLKYYIDQELQFISVDESKHKDNLVERNTICPIGVLDDVEIVFLHYKSQQEVLEKWKRRSKRINWNNIVFKFSEQNYCSMKEIIEFDKLPYDRKIMFTTKDYHVKSQILWGGICIKGDIPNDTVLFRKFIDLIKFINGKIAKKRQRYAEKRLKKLNKAEV